MNNNFDVDFLEKSGQDIYLSNKDKEILKKYGYDYTRYINLENLIFDIEIYLNEHSSAFDLEDLSSRLAEYQYYNNSKK